MTNNTGYFEAPLLQPGTYRVSIEVSGFKTITRDGIALAVGQQVNLPFMLEVGGINEQVTVKAVTPVLDTTSVSSGANFDQKLVESLPMFSNMPISLARFAPGSSLTTISRRCPRGSSRVPAKPPARRLAAWAATPTRSTARPTPASTAAVDVAQLRHDPGDARRDVELRRRRRPRPRQLRSR